MADPFKNARAYYDVTVPSSGDGFQIISQLKNALQGLGFMDMIPLQPRAHSPADTKIMVRGTDASGFYRPIYGADTNTRVFFSSGDSPAFNAPSSNPRIDIVYVTPSGDIRIQQGVEAAVPTLPSLAPSGDTRLPVCAVYNRPGQTRIFNFENSAANTGDGYIYQDLRPFLQQPKAGGASFGTATPANPTGDGQASAGLSQNAARADHSHGGVHAIRKVGSSNLQGDVEIGGPVVQAGNRLTIGGTPAFSVHNNGVNETIPNNANTKLTWSTKLYDTNSNFASDKFTPTVSGIYTFIAQARFLSPGDQIQFIIFIFKNGLAVAYRQFASSGTASCGYEFVVDLPANGTTDFFEVYVKQVNGGSLDIDGDPAQTFFSGHWVANL